MTDRCRRLSRAGPIRSLISNSRYDKLYPAMDGKFYTFRTLIERDTAGYHGYVPSLPGCHTRGKTIEETKRNLKDAITGYLEVAFRYGDPIPQDEGLEFIQSVTVERRKIVSRPKAFSNVKVTTA